MAKVDFYVFIGMDEACDGMVVKKVPNRVAVSADKFQRWCAQLGLAKHNALLLSASQVYELLAKLDNQLA